MLKEPRTATRFPSGPSMSLERMPTTPAQIPSRGWLQVAKRGWRVRLADRICRGTLSCDQITVPYDKEKVRDAPKVESAADHLSADQRAELCRHYGIEWSESVGACHVARPGMARATRRRAMKTTSSTGREKGAFVACSPTKFCLSQPISEPAHVRHLHQPSPR